MSYEIVSRLLYNILLLLVLSIIYTLIPNKLNKLSGIKNVLIGFIIGLLGIAIMLNPLELATGVVFDSRSILISASGLFLGAVPTIIASVIISAFRIYQGGMGALAGTTQIVLITIASLVWRHFRWNKLVENKKNRWLELYIFGIVMHIIMIGTVMILPWEIAVGIYKQITLPVMTLFPLGTLILCLVLLTQLDNKKTYNELESSEKRYRQTFENASIGIVDSVIDEKVLVVNSKFCEMTGYTREELSNITLNDITHPEDIEKNNILIAKLLDGSLSNIEVENRYLKKDKSIFWGKATVSLMRDRRNNPKRFITTIHDLTERKRAELLENKIEIKSREQQKLESIGTLAGGVAHEINNPINGIMNYSQLILDEPKGAEVVEYANEILYETKRVSEIVKNLLEFSRQEKQSFSKANIDDILNKTLSLVKTIIKHDQIDMQIIIEKDLPELNCRSQQLQQVLMNLLTNARDALNQRYEGYHENKKLIIICKKIIKEDKDFIYITVEDYGNGISGSVQDKIFDPFFTTKDRNEGTGLGLSISYRIVKEHNGELTFETKEGEYTKFFVDLPVDSKLKQKGL
jgi:PAS domain S-box-containing protein